MAFSPDNNTGLLLTQSNQFATMDVYLGIIQQTFTPLVNFSWPFTGASGERWFYLNTPLHYKNYLAWPTPAGGVNGTLLLTIPEDQLTNLILHPGGQYLYGCTYGGDRVIKFNIAGTPFQSYSFAYPGKNFWFASDGKSIISCSKKKFRVNTQLTGNDVSFVSDIQLAGSWIYVFSENSVHHEYYLIPSGNNPLTPDASSNHLIVMDTSFTI